MPKSTMPKPTSTSSSTSKHPADYSDQQIELLALLVKVFDSACEDVLYDQDITAKTSLELDAICILVASRLRETSPVVLELALLTFCDKIVKYRKNFQEVDLEEVEAGLARLGRKPVKT